MTTAWNNRAGSNGSGAPRLAAAVRARRRAHSERERQGGRPRPGLLALVATALVLFGCGGGGGDGGGSGTSPAAPAKPPTTQAGSASLEVLGTSASSVSGKVTATDPQGLALTYAVVSPPSAGTVTVDSRSGNFTYTVAGHTTSAQDAFTVAVSNGQTAAVNAVVTVQFKGDPLVANQWHVRNAGASAFSTTPPVAGNDLNVAGAWAAGYSGKGIKIGVVDEAVEVAHEDLAANVDVANSFNFLTNGSDPTMSAGLAGTDHGTQVAGIIGAVGFNGKGGRGVAYSARLRGYNLIAPNALSATNYARAMGGMTASADNAIFNASFRVSSSSALPPPDEAYIAANGNLNTLRGGLGAILVSSAGNDFEGLAGASAQRCTAANSYGVSCGNPASDTRRGGTTPIIVGALNAKGQRASYSNTGSSLWVAAPGGEFGYDAAYYTARKLDPVELEPAIVTTARSGCANRNDFPDVANALVTGTHGQAANCQYTAQMNGTSSAAPNVSGTVALMLEANPKLSARDVKFILAQTARQIDPGLARVTTTDLTDNRSPVTLEQGWVKNGAGRWFSNAYGFGAVDATAAVAMARTYTSFLPPAKTSDFYNTVPEPGLVVPSLSATGLWYTWTVAVPFTTLEQVVVFPNIETTQGLLCNQIELVSPAGTKSILLHAATGFNQTSVNTRILSNAFYGESPNGTWKLVYFNFCSGQTRLSSTTPQRLLFVGR